MDVNIMFLEKCKNTGEKMRKIVNIISWIIILIILVLAFKFYNGNNFNEFVRSKLQLNV